MQLIGLQKEGYALGSTKGRSVQLRGLPKEGYALGSTKERSMQLRVVKIRICFWKHKRVKRAAEGCQNIDMLWEAQKSEACS